MSIKLSAEEAHAYVVNVAEKHHPILAKVIEINGILDLGSSRDDCIVKFLAGAVVSQQLSSKAAGTIWGRICELQAQDGRPFSSFLSKSIAGDLRRCGVSRSKAKAIVGMADTFRAGDLSERRIKTADYNEIVEFITSLWGFGQWSADMLAMFFVKLPDVWPEDDVALARGLALYAPETIPDIVVMRFVPYRTYFARQIWEALDSNLTGAE